MPRTELVNAAPSVRRPEARILSRAGSLQGTPFGQIFPLALLIYSAVLLPPEAAFRFAEVNLPVYRIVIFGLIPLITARFASGRARLNAIDGLLLVMGSWLIISFVNAYGLRAGVIRGSGLAVDALGSYLVARVSLDGTLALRRLLIVIAPALFLAGLEMAVESVARQSLVRPAFARIFGYAANYEGGEVVGDFDFRQPKQIRLGLLRAWGPFPHPILGGVILAGMLPLWLMGGLRSWPKWLGVSSSILGLFSISSAAVLALIMGFALFVIDRLARFTSIRWPQITAGICLLLLALQLASQNGVIRVLARLTLDPQTAYYRILIWKYGFASVAKHPLFGIAFVPYERPSGMTSSIDAHFLALGVRNGVAVPILLIIALLISMMRMGNRSGYVGGIDRNLYIGLNFTLVIVIVSGLTVAFFGGANIWFMAIIGAAASLAVGQATTARMTVMSRLAVIKPGPTAPKDASR